MANNVISALQFGGAEGDIYTLTLPYGVCETAANIASKEVTVNSFALATGSRILVKFTTTNSANDSTLNVNGTGAFVIKYRGSNITKGALAQHRVYEFVYDGTYWQLIGDLDTDTNTEQTLSITDKSKTDTANEVYAITNLVESGTKGHTITPTYTEVPTKKYIDDKIANLGQALRFLGKTTTAISDGSTTSSIVINGTTVSVRTGDVVLYSDNYEYVWTGSAWEQFGQEGSFSAKGHTHTVTVNGTTGSASATTTAATGTVSSSGTGATVVTGSSNAVNVLTGVKASGTETFVTGVNGGSGSLTSSDTASTGRIAYVSGITSTPASGTKTTINTGAKASSTGTFVKAINGGSGGLSSDNNESGGIPYVRSASFTGATIDSTAAAITGISTTSENFVKSVNGGSGSLAAYDAATSGSVKVSNGTRIPVVTSVTHTAATLGTPSTSNVAPSGHNHTYDKATGVTLTANTATATGRVTYVQSISGGSGSLDSYASDDATTADSKTTNGRISYVSNITSTPASASGTAKVGSETHTHNYVKATGVSLGSNTTATDGVKYVEAISGGSGSLTSYDAASGGNAVQSSGRIGYLSDVEYTAPSLTGTTTFVTGVNGGSGSLTSNTTNSGIKYVETQGTFTAGTTPVSSASFSGTKTNELVTGVDTKYLHFTAGTTPASGATANTTSTASGAPSNTITVLTGVKASSTATAVDASYSSGILTLTPKTVVTGVAANGTAKVGSEAHTHSYAKTTSITLTSGTAPSLTIDTTSTNGIGVLTGATKGDYTPAGTISLTRGTAPSLGSASTKYLHHTHAAASASGTATVGISGGSISTTKYYLNHAHTAASATTKYFHPTVTTSTVASGTPSATTTVVTGVTGGSTAATIKYLAHDHTAASATTKYLSATPTTTSVNTGANSGTAVAAVTGYGSFSGGSITPVTYYLAHSHSAASGNTAAALTGVSASETANVATSITGGTLSAITAYMHHSHTGASVTSSADAVTGVTHAGTADVITSVSGGSTAATTKYLEHTHTAASASGTKSAVTGVAANGTVAAITALSTANLDTTTVASNGHTHSYGSSTPLTTSGSQS